MFKYFFGFVIIELVQILCGNERITRLDKKFVAERFYPFMFETLPNTTAQVNYGIVKLGAGTIMTYEEVKDPPKVRYCGKGENLHAIVMARPVIPEDGDLSKYQEFNHWIVGNIPGSKIQKGEVIIPYNISRVPQNSDELYPYVIAVFRQTDKLNFINEIYNETLRTVPGCIRLKQFVSKYDLIGPTKANYFILEVLTNYCGGHIIEGSAYLRLINGIK